ncbi:MAG: hypothetical protein KDA64_09190 [Rhodospirillaceae bacterium]|nr:hypothetical protein [Rhodospirillaceae bacterium]
MTATHRFWQYLQERRPALLLVPAALVVGAATVWLAGFLVDSPPAAVTLIVVAVSVTCLALLRRLLVDVFGYHEVVAHEPGSVLARGVVSRSDLLVPAAVLAAVPALATLIGASSLLGPFAIALGGVIVSSAIAAAISGEVAHPRVGLAAAARAAGYFAIAAYAAGPGWWEHSANTGVIALLAYAFVAGLAWQLGRDLRGPSEVAPGEAVVSDAWGPLAAVIAWFGLMMAAGSLMAAVGLYLPSSWVVAIVIDVTLLVAAIVGIVYARSPSARRGAIVARFTAGWALGVPMVLALRTAAL